MFRVVYVVIAAALASTSRATCPHEESELSGGFQTFRNRILDEKQRETPTEFGYLLTGAHSAPTAMHVREVTHRVFSWIQGDLFGKADSVEFVLDLLAVSDVAYTVNLFSVVGASLAIENFANQLGCLDEQIRIARANWEDARIALSSIPIQTDLVFNRMNQITKGVSPWGLRIGRISPTKLRSLQQGMHRLVATWMQQKQLGLEARILIELDALEHKFTPSLISTIVYTAYGLIANARGAGAVMELAQRESNHREAAARLGQLHDQRTVLLAKFLHAKRIVESIQPTL